MCYCDISCCLATGHAPTATAAANWRNSGYVIGKTSLKAGSEYFRFEMNTVQLRALTRVTIQKIKSLWVLQFEFYVVKGGATNRDMSLTEMCQCSRLYGI